MNLPGGSLLLIYTGRLAATKGMMMLIEAWRELAPAHPRAHLVIVGTGRGSFDDCETMLKEFNRRPFARHARHPDGGRPERHEYLQASDIFVFPSDYEGFSLSILEAMTAGLPLVSTRVGIAAELEQGASFGFLVPPKDPAAFRDALAAALSDEAALPGMGGNAASAVRARFSLRRPRRNATSASFASFAQRRHESRHTISPAQGWAAPAVRISTRSGSCG